MYRVVGWRKRQQEIYDLSMKKIKDSVGVNVKPEECVFLDDIAENLVPFKEMGINTILVQDIGKSIKALESITGYQLH
jgi:HAD superfamily hydrolase (TIGR01509 family)